MKGALKGASKTLVSKLQIIVNEGNILHKSFVKEKLTP